MEVDRQSSRMVVMLANLELISWGLGEVRVECTAKRGLVIFCD